ncbi:conserved membrane protein of unknown function [Bradyrhizobium sp. ORS 285]|uniref:hypothetical protein n=1 Tax=Bradyrhizobium sp. ORS 285 TaxID=115808 RepID=UPI000240AC1A|nr:hypothetical protein [Bradyrhizobium sp. ORS 285]CCD88275.1 conserved membrane hypothetical protein [Bradyrhizobium sp. ORS 285]SMX56075.1 conserved membrane protein of unknown function [Bradyrhizobium sp. ORS 285]
MPDNIALFATIILLLPMFYLLLAAPAFLLVRLDIVPVTRLLRGMFESYFVALAIAGGIGTLAVLADGRPLLALGIGSVAGFALLSRRWFLQRMDARINDRDRGDVTAVRRLRLLHWGGMLSNAVQVGGVLACIPQIAAVS